jgi:glycosyltransferase involved in cell wall biosynthesis
MNNQKAIVIIAEAWGPVNGGINVFNADFAKALGVVLKGYRIKVICVVGELITAETDPEADNVKLLALSENPGSEIRDTRLAEHIKGKLDEYSYNVLWWIGHDIRTGPLAERLKEVSGQGQLALIHHMSYSSYKGYQTGEAMKAYKKDQEQRLLFNRADCTFAVGPLLRDSLDDLIEAESGTKIFEIVPGLPEIKSKSAPRKFTAITYGRLNPENDRVKQIMLGLDAFADAVRKTNDEELPNALQNEPHLYAIGLALEDKQEEEKLRKRLSDNAGRVVNFSPLPYFEDRDELFKQLSRCSLALMLSLHEGFGLVGWEAIAAEIPLIIGQNSGLYHLIRKHCGTIGLALVKTVKVRGDIGIDGTENYRPDDLINVRKAIIDVANNVEEAKKDAKHLKNLLLSPKEGGYCGFTWLMTAKRFSEDLGLIEEDPCTPPSPHPPTTARYADKEVKEALIKHGAVSLLAVGNSIQLIQLNLNGRSETESDNLEVTCRFPEDIHINTKTNSPKTEELIASIKDFDSGIRNYLQSDESFRADEYSKAEWKLGIKLIRPLVDIHNEKHPSIIVHPLSYRSTDLYNRRLVKGKVPTLSGGTHLYPDLVKLYDECIKSLLRSSETYKFPCPSQLFIELALVASDHQVLLVRKKAAVGSGVVAELGRAWTCGPEFGLTFSHLNDDKLMLHTAIVDSVEKEFGLRSEDIEYWHLDGLCLQFIHLNTALYGYCKTYLTGEELKKRFKAKKSNQFYIELEDFTQTEFIKPYPELVDLKNLPDILTEEKRHDGMYWHPSARIRLYSVLKNYSY